MDKGGLLLSYWPPLPVLRENLQACYTVHVQHRKMPLWRGKRCEPNGHTRALASITLLVKRFHLKLGAPELLLDLMLTITLLANNGSAMSGVPIVFPKIR